MPCTYTYCISCLGRELKLQTGPLAGEEASHDVSSRERVKQTLRDTIAVKELGLGHFHRTSCLHDKWRADACGTHERALVAIESEPGCCICDGLTRQIMRSGRKLSWTADQIEAAKSGTKWSTYFKIEVVSSCTQCERQKPFRFYASHLNQPFNTMTMEMLQLLYPPFPHYQITLCRSCNNSTDDGECVWHNHGSRATNAFLLSNSECKCYDCHRPPPETRHRMQRRLHDFENACKRVCIPDATDVVIIRAPGRRSKSGIHECIYFRCLDGVYRNALGEELACTSSTNPLHEESVDTGFKGLTLSANPSGQDKAKTPTSADGRVPVTVSDDG